jgi:hypothetical protein
MLAMQPLGDALSLTWDCAVSIRAPTKIGSAPCSLSIEEDRHLLVEACRVLVRQTTSPAVAHRPPRTTSSKHRVARRAADQAEVRQIAEKVREIVALDMVVTLLTGEQKPPRVSAPMGRLIVNGSLPCFRSNL